MILRIAADQPHALFNTAATRRLEQAAAAALPPHTLMRRAGLAVAQPIVRRAAARLIGRGFLPEHADLDAIDRP